MGRLIDADELLKEFDPNGERLDPIFVRSRIVQQPIAYNVEKVVAELEEASKPLGFGLIPDSRYIAESKAIDIVKRGGVDEHN